MSIQTLTRTIRHLAPQDRLRLFDHLRPTLEDYLLARVASERLRAGSGKKRIPWEDLKPKN